MLIKRTQQHSETASHGSIAAGLSGQTNGLDRRTFLRRSGLAGGALAALGTLPLGGVRQAKAAEAGPLTSGATVDGCARALLRAGAANVDVLIFARVAEAIRTSI